MRWEIGGRELERVRLAGGEGGCGQKLKRRERDVIIMWNEW
jgi:hypothetical protein